MPRALPQQERCPAPAGWPERWGTAPLRSAKERAGIAWAKARDAAANLKDNVTNRVQSVAEDVMGDSVFVKPADSQPPIGRA